MRALRTHLTYANVMSTLAVFLVLGGGVAAAVNKLPKNSVGTKQLKRNAVKGSKVADRSLSAADIRGSVDSATEAAHAARADKAGEADRAAEAERLGGLKATAFQPTKVRTEKVAALKGDPTDFTPDVTGLGVLVLDYEVPTVMGDLANPSLPGGVEGQRLTIVASASQAIFTTQADLKLEGGSWSGSNGDTLTLVQVDGVWHETARSNN